jgi:hypothetical protein
LGTIGKERLFEVEKIDKELVEHCFDQRLDVERWIEKNIWDI